MRRLLRSWRWRVAVDGHSMAPTLRADDWLLVDPDAYAEAAPAVGDIVVVADPAAAGRWLVKRVAGIHGEGSVRLAGDHPAHAAEPALAAVAPAAIVGRAWLRYWPPRRVGRVR
jgi:signal peptidase I